MDIEKKTTLKMGITYPEHPLMKMFFRPPIMEKFKDETARRENDRSATTEGMRIRSALKPLKRFCKRFM